MSAEQFPTDPQRQAAFIHKARLDVIQKLAIASRNAKGVPDVSTEPGKSLSVRLDVLLSGLAEKVIMTPELRRATKVDEGLQLIYDNPKYHFPKQHKEAAKALFKKWQSEHWGGVPSVPLVDTSEGNDEVERSPKRQKKDPKKSSKDRTVVKLPPKDHPIWGVNGIMHGLALYTNLDKNNKKSTGLNDEYEREKRNAKVFGHNGIAPGTWYPSQLNALFRGAHGHSQAGISGDTGLGAYSIVVSGLYGDLDQDKGEALYYSGSRSHNNTNPDQVAASSEGTKALETSISSGRLVRVLRASRGHSRYAPTEGIRYDGLYRVINKRYPRNALGGMYEQFELVREDGQTSLDNCRSRPNGRDLDDFSRIKNGYPSRR